MAPVAVAVAAKDKAVAKAVEDIDSEAGALLRRQNIDTLKGKVIQLRKEVGKPVPGAAGNDQDNCGGGTGGMYIFHISRVGEN